ncbi:MAG: CopG family transcriptional regulator [Gammaproteobacteria bacterium RIFCSPHIGHO2_12_FULL_45_9]|nr:MAG: CopG family transcriptional regulator [Gammaproteobacteria bacterium RIFCSPHIGHO2_12_FULL_45_9]
MHTTTEKISISLPPVLSNFIEAYQLAHNCKSRSEVIQKSLKLLQQKELEGFYRKAASEIDPLFEVTANDGLDDETR